MIGTAAVAALTAIAGLAGKAQKDAERARAEKRARLQHREDQRKAILKNRARQSGVSTFRSDMQDSDEQFEKALQAAQPDTSGDFVPFVNALTQMGGAIAQDVQSSPSKPKTDLTPYYKGQTGFTQADPNAGSMLMGMVDEEDDDATRQFLQGLSRQSR